MKPPRTYSLAYLTANTLDPVRAIELAAGLGYREVGLRLMPNAAGAPQQFLLGNPAAIAQTKTAIKNTGVGIFDLEIIRLGADFDLSKYLPLMELGGLLQAKAILVAADDTDQTRRVENYARLCEAMKPFGLTADLEFMPWTAVRNAREALDLITSAGMPDNAGILIDALHFDRSDTRLEDLRALPRHLLHYVQICDAPGRSAQARPFSVEEMIHTARCERLLPGDGSIDLKALFDILPQDIPVSVEIPNEVQLASMGQAAWALEALEKSRRLLESDGPGK